MKTIIITIAWCALLACAALASAHVAEDVKAGLPPAEVIRNGIDQGLAIETIVTQAIRAGADPAAIVQAAVMAAPGSTYRIVRAAVTEKRELAITIMKAALAVQQVVPASVISGIASAVTDDQRLLESLRVEAAKSGVPATTVDAAIARGMGSAETFGATGHGSESAFAPGINGNGRGSGGGGGPVSPYR